MRYALPAVMVLVILLAASAVFFHGIPPVTPQELPYYSYQVIHTYPHDRYAFTEGLAYHEGVLIESTGLAGNSSIRLVNLTTGQIIIEHQLPDVVFGEGATVFGNRIAQLTENSGTGFLYEASNLTPSGAFRYSTKGWGITNSGMYLIMSDGSSSLYFLDPGSFRVTKTLTVTAGGEPVVHINELEYVDGEIYANIWPSNLVARISPENGMVTGWIDLAGILSPGDHKQIGWSALAGMWGNTSVILPEEACPNGIAYDAGGDRLFVTGKLWPALFEIRLVPTGKI